MNEKNDITIESAKDKNKSIGGILRKQRISMNISIDKISKDLRINKIYIEAIENDDFNSVPGTPYVRVYVKTIAEYLSLDSTRLLNLLSDENSRIEDLFAKENNAAIEKSTTSVSANNSVKKKNGKFGITAMILISLLIGAYFVMKQYNWNNYVADFEDSESFAVISEEQIDSLDYSLPDSLIRGDTVITKDTVATDTAVTPENFEMSIQVIKDSSWIQIVSDGVITFDRVLRAPSRIIKASANDSVNIYAGGGSASVDIFVNGKKISKAGATGIWTLTRNEVRNLTPADWRRVKKVTQ
jgi:cytoskeletal protein RodZ